MRRTHTDRSVVLRDIRLIRVLFGLGCALAAVVIAPAALNRAARWLIRVDPLRPADVIMALGGDPRCGREREAAELYRRGLAPRIIVSGVPYAWGLNTGESARQYLLSLGIPEKDILVFRESWNTRIEARELIRLMRENGWKSALIVTSPFHSRRALFTVERRAPDLAFLSAPVAARPPEWQPERWWARRGDMGTTVREYLSWANTLIGGLE